MLIVHLLKAKTRTSNILASVLTSTIVIGCIFLNTVYAQVTELTMHQLTVEVEHESGEEVTIEVGRAGETEIFVFSLAQAKDSQFVANQLSDLEPPVLEAVLGALLRINRSEVLVNSERVDEVEVEWVTETCNDTNADCESIIQRIEHSSTPKTLH